MIKTNNLSYRWVILLVSFVTLVLGYAVRNCFSVFYPTIVEEFGWQRGNTALIFSISVIVYGLTAPLAGWLADRFGPRIILPIGAIIMGSGIALCGLADTQWEFFLVALVIAGLPEMLAGVCFFTLMQRHLPPHQAEIFYSLSAPIFYGCIILGTLLGGLYTQNLIGLGEFWLLISMLCLGTALPFLPRIRTPRYA